jgi:tRNA threonylcarbamoyladenosine modification (KEOPS) complex  Pcc1 subunit
MRRATITTDHDDRETAEHVARAVTPDNTTEITTQVEEGTVVTTIARESTSGLHATVDDYVVNLTVAAQLADNPTTNDT